MASAPTTRNSLNKQGTGDNSGTWGTTLNEQVFDLVDTALDGFVSIPVAANVTLSSTNFVDNEARNRVLKFTGAGGFNVVIPGVEKWYLVHNACTAAVVVKTSGGTGATINPATITPVYCDGTDCAQATSLWPLANGTVAAPALYFTSDTDTGLYRIGANNIGVAANGAKVLDVGTAGLGVTGTGTFSGAMTAASYSMAQGSIVTTGANAFTAISDGSNTTRLYLGGTGDPTNYYDNTTHLFRNRAAAASFATINSTGLNVTGTGIFSSGITATTGTFSSSATFGGTVTATGGLVSGSGATINGALAAATTGTFSGAVSMAGLTATTGTFSGTLGGVAGVFSGTLSGAGITSTGGTGIAAGGPLTATTGTFSGAVSMTGLTATTVTASGAVNFGSTFGATTGTFSGAVTVGTTLDVTGQSTLAGLGATSINVNSGLFRAITTAVGFYGATPVAKQTGVAVTAAGVHAALVNLGLIS